MKEVNLMLRNKVSWHIISQKVKEAPWTRWRQPGEAWRSWRLGTQKEKWPEWSWRGRHGPEHARPAWFGFSLNAMKPLENLAWLPAYSWKWDLAAYHSKGNKEARLVERKVCFILESGDGGGVGLLSKGQLLPSTPTRQSVGKSFYRWREGALYRNGSNSDSHLKIGHTVGWPASWLFLGTVNLHFQGRFVSISWDQFLDLWQLTYTMATVWSSWS